MKWEEIREQVTQQVTKAELSARIYKRIASTRVNSLAIIRPSYYISNISELVMDYITFVDKFMHTQERDWEGYLKFILFIKDCCRNISVNIREVSEPLEILIENMEEIFESEEFADEGSVEEEEGPPAEETEKKEEKEEKKESAGSIEIEQGDLVRESFTTDREALEETLRVKFRDEIRISDAVGKAFAQKLSEVYLECIQFLRSRIRLVTAPEGDVSTILSILIDLQYGLDDQMRRLLIEDFFIEDLPSYSPGINTWIAHFLSELTELISAEESSLIKK
jgi:hypothetical protein